MSAWTSRAVRRTAIGLVATTLLVGLLPGTGAAENLRSTPAAEPAASAATPGRGHLTLAEQRALREHRALMERRNERHRRALRAERREERLSALRQRAAQIAIAQIGDAYGYGGDGPHVFDCSGLTQFAWGRVGVQLTHYSRAQWGQTRRISLKDAEPGDLAFYFDNGASHVAMYVGNGMVVGAVDYGIGVKRTPVVGTPWTDAHFTGMGRVVG